MATTVTSKGQVTIPKDIRNAFGIEAGNSVAFSVAADGRIVVEKIPDRRFAARIESIRGIAGPGMSTDEVMTLTRGED
jgi:AbrB family looped-hinge helix DNA binding protein